MKLMAKYDTYEVNILGKLHFKEGPREFKAINKESHFPKIRYQFMQHFQPQIWTEDWMRH